MTSLNQRIKVLEVYSGIETSVISISDVSELQTELDTKQDTLTAGDNITIVDNIISSSGSGGGGASNISEITGLQDELDALSLTDTTLQTSIDSKQDILTAGDNISIVDNVISSSGSGSSSSIEVFKFSMVRSDSVITFYNNNLLTFVNLDRQTSGLNMSSNDGTITFAGSNVTGTWEIKYSLIISNIMSTTSRINIRAYLNGLWVAEWGKLNGSMEDGNFIVDVEDGDTLDFKPIALQGSNALYVDTGLVTETYDACVLYGVKLY